MPNATESWAMLTDRPQDQGRLGWRGWAGWKFECGVLLVATFVSLVVGCLFNTLRAEPLPWVYASRAEVMDAAVARLSAEQPAAMAESPHEIRLDDFQSFVAERQGLVVDTRARAFYDLARVPGAVSLPRGAFAGEYPRLREKLAAYKEQPVVVYCSGADCPDAQLVADALAKLGFRHLLIYTAGWEEWSQTGLPQEGSAVTP